MRFATWMAEDERTPEEKRRDKLRHLQHRQSSLMKQLEQVNAEIAQAVSATTK